MIHSSTNLRILLLRMLLSVPLMAAAAPPDWSARFEPADGGIPMSPNEWTLGPLTEGSGPPILYIYPQTINSVRLYLIDTAVKHSSTWFSNNPKLTFRGTVRTSSGASKSFKHGTRMLSIIAGPETGAALGTPIEVVNYDVYPGGEGSNTDANSVAGAVGMAEADHRTSGNPMPAVICIASGSTTITESYFLRSNIDSAIAAGMTVIVSAGNLGVDVSPGYIPAAYGLNPGVICVGANGLDGLRLPISNFGAPVDLFAPGEKVRTLRFTLPKAGAYEVMTGTSPAAALATAAALIELSLNPQLTPAQVEEALTGETTSPIAASLLGAGLQTGATDSDNDGTEDMLEAFLGSNPSDPTSRARPLQIQTAGGKARLSFGVAATLFDSMDPYSLSNGTTWRVQQSTDLASWQDVGGSMTTGPAVDGIIPISFEIPSTAPTGFLRVEVMAQLSSK